MMSIPRVPFSELLSVVIDNRGRTCPTADAGRDLIATNCVLNTALYPIRESVRHVAEDTYRNWFRGHPKPGDILFVCKGTPGRVALVPDPVTFCIAQDMVAVRADPRKVDPYFLFAALRSQDAQNQISSNHVGSMIPHFKKGDFDKLLLPVPPRSVQEFIGESYLAFSKRIELNRRTNETLEAMARAIFQSWFVAFDPVRAKMEGRQPEGMDAETARLFPSAFADDAGGGVPVGWRPGDIYELGAVDYGAPYSSRLFNNREEGLPVIRIRDLKSQAPDLFTPERHPRDVVVRPGDVLVGMDGEFRATVWHGPEALLNQRVCRFRPHRTTDTTFLRLASEESLAFVERTEVATTVIHLGKGDIDEFRVMVPPVDVRDAYAATAEPIRKRQMRLDQEAASLSTLRDTLLPKLLSGELRVPDAERAVSAAL